MSKIVAFVGVAAGLGGCAWLACWRSAAVPVHEAAPVLVLAAGLFTVAIAVFIRD